LFGRVLYQAGSNPRAAAAAGMRVRLHLFVAYVACSMIIAFGALMMTARTGSGGAPTSAANLALETIAAAVIGGMSLRGGEGGMLAPVVGALFVTVAVERHEFDADRRLSPGHRARLDHHCRPVPRPQANRPLLARRDGTMAYQVCIDIGGTFTDCLVSDEAGRIQIFKAPSTPGEVREGLHRRAPRRCRGARPRLRDFIAAIEIVVHGSTVSTNALVERKTARAGLILNDGHADILGCGEGPRKGRFEWRLDYPDPYIPRNLTPHGARPGSDARGREIGAAVGRRRRGRDRPFPGRLEGRIDRGRPAVVGGRAPPRARGPRDHRPALARDSGDAQPRDQPIPAGNTSASSRPRSTPRSARIIRTYVDRLARALDGEGFTGELLLANCLGGRMMPPAEDDPPADIPA